MKAVAEVEQSHHADALESRVADLENQDAVGRATGVKESGGMECERKVVLSGCRVLSRDIQCLSG